MTRVSRTEGERRGKGARNHYTDQFTLDLLRQLSLLAITFIQLLTCRPTQISLSLAAQNYGTFFDEPQHQSNNFVEPQLAKLSKYVRDVRCKIRLTLLDSVQQIIDTITGYTAARLSIEVPIDNTTPRWMLHESNLNNSLSNCNIFPCAFICWVPVPRITKPRRNLFLSRSTTSFDPSVLLFG